MGASLMTTLGTLPVFLLSSQSVFVREELGFDEVRFGIAVSVFFGSAALAALLGGGLTDRMGRRRSTILAGAIAAVGGLGVALLAHSWVVLLGLLVLLGMANAACQVTANLTMARVIPAHRRGLGFGIKQSAIPISIMLAGLAVPTLGAFGWWRWTFAATGVGGLLVLLSGLRLPRTVEGPVAAGAERDRPPMRALVITLLAITLASAAANSLGSFLASWGFHVGLTPSEAGVLMAVGSGANLVLRVLLGHRADGRHGRNLPGVALQMVIGGLALGVLAIESPATVVLAGFVAFALGWSWPGLLLYAVVRVGRDAPGAASGMVQGGAFIGGATGPALFGAVVGWVGYQAAWGIAGVLFVAAGALILAARKVFLADLVNRPPVRQISYGGGRGRPAHVTAPHTLVPTPAEAVPDAPPDAPRPDPDGTAGAATRPRGD
ncbi:hypothetical protein GCM10009583_05580 [Ornithinicoccus hortensis]